MKSMLGLYLTRLCKTHWGFMQCIGPGCRAWMGLSSPATHQRPYAALWERQLSSVWTQLCSAVCKEDGADKHKVSENNGKTETCLVLMREPCWITARNEGYQQRAPLPASVCGVSLCFPKASFTFLLLYHVVSAAAPCCAAGKKTFSRFSKRREVFSY